MKFMFVALLIMLSACSSMDAKRSPRPHAQSEQTNMPFIWRAHGTEPFWGFTVDQNQVRFESLGDVPSFFPYSGFDNEGGLRLFKASAVTGATTSTIAIRLTRQGCSDGMSDIFYPWRAEVEIDGKRLQGCARRGDQTE